MDRVQCVVSESEVDDSVFKICRMLDRETPVSVTGLVEKDNRAPGGFEIRADDLNVIQPAKKFPVKESDPIARLMDRRYLSIRFDRQQAVLGVRSEIVHACHNFFQKKGFVYIDPPLIMPDSYNGGDSIFDIDYFGQRAFLTGRYPFYINAAAGAFGRAYTISPMLRKESNIRADRLTEVRILEVFSVHKDLDSIIKLAESLLRAIIRTVLKNRSDSLLLLRKNLSALKNITPRIQRINFMDAARLLSERRAKEIGAGDFSSADMAVIARKHGQPFVIQGLPNPGEHVFLKTETGSGHSLGFYLIASGPMGKIISGGQYEDNCAMLRDRLRTPDFSSDLKKRILELCGYGLSPSAGFRLCIEKLTAWLCGLKHIREASLFPRMRHRLSP